MRNSYLGLVLVLGLSSGGLMACGQCDIGCIVTMKLTVRDPSGAQVPSFSGVVSLEGESLAVACPASQPASQPVGYECERYANLKLYAKPFGGSVLPFRGSPTGLEVELTSTSTPVLAFSGPVLLDIHEAETCGPTCVSGTATVTLR